MLKLSEKEISLAKKGKKILEKHNPEMQNDDPELVLHDDTATNIPLPKTALRALAEVLTHISEGNDVEVRAVKEELTTQQAGDFLHVSRPFLIKLLEKGEIPYRKVGNHRRIRLAVLHEYKRQIDEKRLDTLNKLTAEGQELEMGY